MKPRTTVTVVVIIGIILIGSFFFYQQRSAVYAELSSLKLVPQPERFTELYFENASALPRAIVAGRPVSFAFAIHNVESATTTYPYKVYFEYPSGEQVNFATGTVTLAHGAIATVAVSHTFPAVDQYGKVVVDLPSQGDQSIDFWLPDKS